MKAKDFLKKVTTITNGTAKDMFKNVHLYCFGSDKSYIYNSIHKGISYNTKQKAILKNEIQKAYYKENQ